MTPTDVISAVYARMEYDATISREHWERTRMVAYFSVAPHDSKGKGRKPNDYLPLPWDKDETKPAKDQESENLAKIKRWNKADGL
jgi:hypothetical protein|tara:strand:- start:77 stop:331 length:255 start_codon:yes stop_codon:yes gene_type:complete